MGCDFELQIQVFFQDRWIPVVFFGTKTRCGGFPLGTATRMLYKQKGIKGDYHRNDQVAYTYEDTMKHLGFPPDARPPTKQFYFYDTEGNLIEDQEDPEYNAKKYKSFLFYSRDQFQQLIRCIQPLPGHKPPYSELYINLMKPVLAWMSISKSVWPMQDEIWMSDEKSEIEKTTQALLIAQKRKIDHYKFLFLCFRFLPRELIQIILEFAFPCGSDVRVAWWDDEGHSELMVGYSSPEEAIEPQADCVVM
jgi:hypothetical protein